MFALVTDSTAYLTKAEAKQWNVLVVGMNYTDSEKNYTESYSDCNGNFDRLIGKGRWTTSHPSIDSYKTQFNKPNKKDVLCLCMSSRLSGAYSSALVAARETENKNVLVFDSLSAVGGLKLQVKRAVELRNKGLSAKEVMEILEKEKQSIKLIFSIDSMEPLRKSGRIGVVRQAVSTILDIRPILRLSDGSIVSSGLSKGRLDQIKKLIDSITNTDEIDVAYFGSPQTALRLMGGIKQKHPDAQITVSSVGPVLGIHLGLTAIGVAYREKA